MKGNQLRMCFSALAYTLVEALRRLALQGTEWAQAQVGEKALAGSRLGAGLLPKRLQAIADRMEVESQQIRHHQKLRQILLAAPQVVLQVVAMIFEHVETFVFDLPAGARTGSDFGHIFVVDR